MNQLDKQYTDLLQDILNNGIVKSDRTGTGTKSVFGRTIRHNMADGFPLLTTKKMPWKTIVTELIWFLRGDTNIKYLVNNGCNIWNGDAHKKYVNLCSANDSKWNEWMRDNGDGTLSMYTMKEFIEKIKTDDKFAEKWGDLGPIYGKQWRYWGGYIKTHTSGVIQKDGDTWVMHWSDTNGYDDCCYTPIKNYHHLTELDINTRVVFDFEGDYRTFNPLRYAIINTNPKVEYKGGVDQIAELIHNLKNNPDSRRLMVNAWNVGEIKDMTLPPCHYGFQCYTRELSDYDVVEYYYNHIEIGGLWSYNAETDKYFYHVEGMEYTWVEHSGSDILGMRGKVPTRYLSLQWNQRSVDTFLGLPFNIASYGLLLEILAKEVNMIPDELIGNLGDTHLYLNHLGQAKEQIGEKFISDELVLNILNTEHPEKFKEYITIKGEKMKYIEKQDYENAAKARDKELDLLSELSDFFNKKSRKPYPLPTIEFANDIKWKEGDNLPYYSPSDIKLVGYKSHPTIKAPLSN